MSIRGVDAQLMIARSPDFAREASQQQKLGDHMQSFMAAQAKSEAEHEKAYVAKTEQPPEPELHLENEGGGNAGAYSSSKKKRAEEELREPSLLDADVGRGNHIIDIKL